MASVANGVIHNDIPGLVRGGGNLFHCQVGRGLTAQSGVAVLWRGFTLVELLVAMLIMVIVTTVAMSVFNLSARHEVRQQDILEQMQNLRAAMYAVARDARMAGNGLAAVGLPLVQIYINQDETIINANIQDCSVSKWFRYQGATFDGVIAIFGRDSGAAYQSDILTIFRTEIENINPIGTISDAFRPGDSSAIGQVLVLKDSVTFGNSIADGDMIIVADGSRAVLLQATGTGVTNTIRLGNRFRPAAPMPDNYTFDVGASIYNVRDVSFVSYYVDTAANRLLANYHDQTIVDHGSDYGNQSLVTVADNIEDFQVQYFTRRPFSNVMGPVSSLNAQELAGGVEWAESIVFAMTAISRAASGFGGEHVPKALGHSMGHSNDKHSRRVMTQRIQLRNYYTAE